MFLALLMLTGCGAGKETVNIPGYGDAPIEISGLKEQDFTVTPNELLNLECVSRTASGATAKAGTVNAYGPLLDTFLEQYHCSMSDFYKIRFICADDYKTLLKGEYLTDYEVVLVISCGDESLPEKQQPLRILIPKAESGMWAYAIVRIEFEREAS